MLPIEADVTNENESFKTKVTQRFILTTEFFLPIIPVLEEDII